MVIISIAEWLRSVEAGTLATTIRQSLWLYPFLEIIHILGIVIVAGAAILFDLRLLNITFKIPVAQMAGYLLPWSRRGLFLVIPSGVLMFITNAEALAKSGTFQLKMILLVAAALNALIFDYFVFKPHLKRNGTAAITPLSKLNAVFSVVVWIAIIACGRLIAYL